MPYEILIHELAAEEVERLPTFQQRRIIESIEQQLSLEPSGPTRRRKCLLGLAPSFEHVLPVWQLRVGDYRIFYDVDETKQLVNIRAIRRKGTQQTEDIT